MKVDPCALAGITAKVDRAGEHFALLHNEMFVWNERKPWRLIEQTHNQGRKHFYRLVIFDPIPIRWAVILGEAIHDLRSALEQSVYWLTVDHSGHDVGGTGFPVNSVKADFTRTRRNSTVWTPDSGMHKIRGVGSGPEAFIEWLQPYPQRRGRRVQCNDLHMLHNLWNQDKHRLVHLWGIQYSDEKLRLAKPHAAACQLYIDRRVHQHGAIVMKAICTIPYDSVPVEGTARANLAFTGGRQARGGARRSLWDVAQTIADIVNKLVFAVDRQDKPITTATWTVPPGYPTPT